MEAQDERGGCAPMSDEATAAIRALPTGGESGA